MLQRFQAVRRVVSANAAMYPKGMRFDDVPVVGWVERSEPHQKKKQPQNWWGSLRSTHPTREELPWQL
jgi:hypothetical protein